MFYSDLAMTFDPSLTGSVWAEHITDFCRFCKHVWYELFCDACKKKFWDKHIHVGHHGCVGKPGTVRISEVNQDLQCCRQVYCMCTNFSPVFVYCYSKKTLICKGCTKGLPRGWKTVPILKKCASYKKANLSAVIEKAKKLFEENKQLLNEKQTQIKLFMTLKQNAIRNIRKFGTIIIKHFDFKEQEMLEELEGHALEYLGEIEYHVRECSYHETSLQKDLNCLIEIQKNNFKADMFAADLIVSKRLNKYELDINYIQQSSSLILKRGEILRNLLIKINTLAQSFEDNTDNGQNVAFADTKQTSLNKTGVNQSQTSDKIQVHRGCKRLHINRQFNFYQRELYEGARGTSGCVFMPDDKAVLCTECVVLIDESLDVIDRLKLPNDISPFDVSVINDTTVIVTLPDKQQLQYINVESEQLKPGRILQMEKSYYGVEVVGKTIYVTYIEFDESSEPADDDKAEVQCLDLDGKLLKRFGVNQDGSLLFKRPYYLTVNTSSEKIYVSDEAKDTVTCLNFDGTVVFQYKDPELDSPRGLCAYDDDNIVIVSKLYLHFVTANGAKQRVQVFNKFDFRDDTYYRWENEARSIAYRRTDGAMILGIGKFANDSLGVNYPRFHYWWSFFD